MKSMSDEERREFLKAGKRTGKLATIRSDGRPHVVPVWYVVDGDDILFTSWYSTAKSKDMLRDPRVAFCVDDDQPPYSFVEVEGIAHIEQHAADLMQWATRIAARYMGEELAEGFGKRNAVEGEWLVRIVPDKFVAQTGIAD